MAKATLTGDNTHRAVRKGYAIPENSGGVGAIVEAGDMVPAGVPLAVEDDDSTTPDNFWMEPVGKKEAKVAVAVAEAMDPLTKDVDYTQLTIAALQAIAADHGVNVKGLSKDDLITAIKAADDPAR